MNDELVEIMGSKQAPLARRIDGNPTVILLAGLQGTGKTTAAAKLAKCVPTYSMPISIFVSAGATILSYIDTFESNPRFIFLEEIPEHKFRPGFTGI